MSMMYRVNAGNIPENSWIQDSDMGGGRILGEVEDWWIDVDFIDDEFSLIERLKAIVQATVV